MSVSAASDPARRPAPRALGRRHGRLARALSGLLLAGALLPLGAAQAQGMVASGQIYIPGPGETHAAQPGGTTVTIPGPGQPQAAAVGAATSGAATNGMIVIPGPRQSQASAPRAARAGAATNGMIVIPGPGESQASAPGAAPTAAGTNGMIVIPGPGESRTSATNHAAARAATLARPSSAAAANRVMPVVVTAPQRAIRDAQPIAVEPPANARFAPAAATTPARAAGEAPIAPARPPAAVQAPVTPAAPASAALAPAQNVPSGQEDGESIRRAALAFLQQQTLGLPGKITIKVAPTFPRGLAACTALEPFMPTGARLWGTTSVGVRCAGAKPWTLYLQARIAIESTYYLAARQIEPGTVVSAQDLLARDGDLSNLPRAIITDPQQAIGATAITRISAGMPLRQDLLKSASAVTIGQTVHVVAQGQGFQISSEGSVMNNAAPGQQVRVKMAGGQIISGIVVDGATVQVQM